jgi:putative ABC transport system permease protein
VDTLWLDIRYAARTLLKRPGFLIVAVITLAIGIGANTAVFSVVNSVLLRPLPYKDSDRIVRIIQIRPPGSVPEGIPLRTAAMRTDDLQEWRTRTKTLAYIAAYTGATLTLTQNGESTRLTGARISPAMLPLLGAQPLIGRAFDQSDEAPGNDSVVLFSYAAWQKYFAGKPDVIGRTVSLDGRGYQVTGVMPEAFEFLNPQAEFWIPFVLTPVLRIPGEHRIQLVQAIARLADGVSLEAAKSEARVLFKAFRQAENEFFAANPGPARGGSPARRLFGNALDTDIQLVSLKEELIAPVRAPLVVLLVAVGFVLLIACTNVANLLLARAAGRQTEIAVRAALGAGRIRLVRQVLTESVMLALLGGLVGALLGFAGVRLLGAIGATSIPRLEEIRVDVTVLAFTLVTSVITGILFGLAPAVRVARTDHMQTIKEGAATSSGGDLFGRNRTRSVLAVAEVALALVLLAGAGLLVNSFLTLSRVDPGYDPANVLTFQVPLPPGRYAGQQQVEFYEQVLNRIRELPGVRAAALANVLPLRQGGIMRAIFNIEGRPAPTTPEEAVIGDVRIISSDYLTAMGIQLLEGRAFGDRDGAGQAPVVLINQVMARRYFSTSNAIGQRVRITAEREPAEIVGLVGNVRFVGLDTDPVPEVYINLAQASAILPAPPSPPSGGGPGQGFVLGPIVFGVRTAGEPMELVGGIRALVRQMDAQLVVDGMATMEQRVYDSVATPRFYAVVLGVFAAIAVSLAAVGVYGLMAYSVSQRTREIGIRLALGAQRSELLGLILKQGAVLTVLGVALGVIGALVLTRYLENLLFGLTPTDPATFVAVALILVVVAMAASYVPARRATKVDPVVALRYE